MPPRSKKDALTVASSKLGTVNWRQSAAIQRVYEQIPQEEVIQALIDTGNDKAIQLAERLSDSKLSRMDLARHCAKVGMIPKEVWTILTESRRLALRLHLSEAVVPVVDAVIDQSVAKVIDCLKCKGTGKVQSADIEIDCTVCYGTGSIVRPADRESQKMALELGELLNQKVPMIAQQFNTFGRTSDAGAPDMTDWTRTTDSLFEEHGKARVIDVEVVATPNTEA